MSNITKNLNIYKDVTNLIGARSFGKEDLVVPYRQLNGTKVGSPTISKDFIASGFNYGSYIRTNYIFNPSSYDWEWCCKFRRTENYTSDVQYVMNGARWNYAPYLAILTSGQINFSIGYGPGYAAGWSTDFVAEINKWYWAKLSYTTGVGYKLEISEDGVNWAQIGETYTSFITFNPTYEIYLAYCEHNTYLRGEIDLKKTYIKVNGVDVWRGVKGLSQISRNDMQNYVLSGIDVQPVINDNKAVIDFSNVKLPWKFEHSDKLLTSRFAIAPLGTTVTQTKYVKDVSGQWVATEETETLKGCVRYYYGEGEHVTTPPRDSSQYYNIYAVDGDEGIVLDSKWYYSGGLTTRPVLGDGPIPDFEKEWYLGEYRVETGEEGSPYSPDSDYFNPLPGGGIVLS